MGMSSWPTYVSAAAKLLRPGGFIELQELDTRFYMNGTVCDQKWEWASILRTEAARRGIYVLTLVVFPYFLVVSIIQKPLEQVRNILPMEIEHLSG